MTTRFQCGAQAVPATAQACHGSIGRESGSIVLGLSVFSWCSLVSGFSRIRNLAIFATAIFHPLHAERVEDQAVGQRELPGVEGSLVGVVHDRIPGDAPGFVADEACTVFARCPGVILVAVEDGCLQQDESDLSKPGGASGRK
jgi:hypothetical protein